MAAMASTSWTLRPTSPIRSPWPRSAARSSPASAASTCWSTMRRSTRRSKIRWPARWCGSRTFRSSCGNGRSR